MSSLQPLSRRTLLAIARSVPRTASRRLESTAASTTLRPSSDAGGAAAAASVKKATNSAGQKVSSQARSAAQDAKSAADDVASRAKAALESATTTAKSAAEEIASLAKSAAEEASATAKSAQQTAQTAGHGLNTAQEAAAQKTRETASRASEGLSRVATAAAPVIAQTANRLGQSLSTLSRVGGPVGKTASVVQQQLPTIIYWARVSAELSRLVFRAQNMSPPSINSFLAYFRTWYTRSAEFLRHSIWKTNMEQAFSRASATGSSVTISHVVTAAVIFAECLGFFTVGEMIGRWKIVGYHGTVGHHE